MLSARTEQLFGDNAAAAGDVLLANNEKYSKGNEVFQVNVEQTEAVQTIEDGNRYLHFTGLWHCFCF